MKKKIVCLILALLCSFACCAAAEEMNNVKPVFQLSDTTADCGETVSVFISLKESPAVASFTLDITYDKKVLNPVAVNKTALLTGQMIPNLQFADNKVRIVYAGNDNIASVGEILELSFVVYDYQKGGITTPVTGEIQFLANRELENVQGEITASSVTVSENPNYVENKEKTLNISGAKCFYNEEIIVKITASEALEVCSGSLVISYDSGLQILQCEKGEILADSNVMIHPENEKNQIRMNFMGVNPISEAGDLLRIKLLVKSNETKNYNVKITDVSMFKLDESYVPIIANTGVIEVMEKVVSHPVGGGSATGGSTSGGSGGNNTPVVNIPPVTETQELSWSNPFSDVGEKDWFFEAVRYVNERQLMSGVSQTEFAPNLSLTRAMLVTVLYRNEGSPEVLLSSAFSDVLSGSYYEKAVVWAKETGIVNGYSETEFLPDADISREQIATIIYRYAQYRKLDVTENTNLLSYEDFNSISEYAVGALQYAVDRGLIRGKTLSALSPKDFATRAEIATILQRFLEME